MKENAYGYVNRIRYILETKKISWKRKRYPGNEKMKELTIKSILFRDYIEITQRKGIVKFDVVIDNGGNEFIITKEELLKFLSK